MVSEPARVPGVLIVLITLVALNTYIMVFVGVILSFKWTKALTCYRNVRYYVIGFCQSCDIPNTRWRWSLVHCYERVDDPQVSLVWQANRLCSLYRTGTDKNVKTVSRP